jgi:putative SOS response-associated peptidase YedK
VILGPYLDQGPSAQGPTAGWGRDRRQTGQAGQRRAVSLFQQPGKGLGQAPRGSGREAALLRWGLIPPWSKDPKQAPINARAETAADKPTFRHALRKRRCLVPADGFYEWAAVGGRKQPCCLRPWDERPWAFAGLWERWEGPEGPVESCAVLTTEANELVRPVHDRMPVILPERHWAAWLDAGLQDAAELVPLLRPIPSDAMRAYPVGALVNNPRNEGPECLTEAV